MMELVNTFADYLQTKIDMMENADKEQRKINFICNMQLEIEEFIRELSELIQEKAYPQFLLTGYNLRLNRYHYDDKTGRIVVEVLIPKSSNDKLSSFHCGILTDVIQSDINMTVANILYECGMDAYSIFPIIACNSTSVIKITDDGMFFHLLIGYQSVY